MTVSDWAAAAWTSIPDSVPVRPCLFVSVAVIVCARCIQRGGKAVLALVGGGEGIARPEGRPVGRCWSTGPCRGSRRQVAIRVDGVTVKVPARRPCRSSESRRRPASRRGRLDDDVRLGADDARGRVGRGDRLCTRGIERDGEGVLAVVGGGEGIAGRQDGLRVGAGEGHRAGEIRSPGCRRDRRSTVK